jgi:hypothetical protein
MFGTTGMSEWIIGAAVARHPTMDEAVVVQ